MGEIQKRQEKLEREAGQFFFDRVNEIIYIIACVASLGLVYLLRIIIEKGVTYPVNSLVLVTQDIETEVCKIKSELEDIKKTVNDIEAMVENYKGK